MDADDRSTSMNVSLPRALREFVEQRVASSAYTSASEYVRELIRRDRERRSRDDRIEGLLLEGLTSGPATEWTDADWAELRRRIGERLETERG